MAMDTSMPVLVVDDYNTMIRIIRNLLKQIGFSHISARPRHPGQKAETIAAFKKISRPR